MTKHIVDRDSCFYENGFPKYKVLYYVPDIDSPDLYKHVICKSSKTSMQVEDLLNYENGLIFKTKEDAVEFAKIIFDIGG